MVSSGQIKHIRSFHQKKFRDQHRRFIAEGPKIVDELLRSGWIIDMVAATPNYLDSRKDLVKNLDALVLEANQGELERLSTLSAPNSVIAIANYPADHPNPAIRREGLILALDGISDPGNLGTIIRTADWFNIRQIVCSPDTTDLFNPKVIQATMGSFLRVRVSYTELPSWLQAAEVPKYGAVVGGENIYEIAVIPEHCILVIGSESHGLRKGVAAALDRGIAIPSPGTKAESLNAALAATIIISEFMRKTHWP